MKWLWGLSAAVWLAASVAAMVTHKPEARECLTLMLLCFLLYDQEKVAR